jgi:hypothetical protein
MAPACILRSNLARLDLLHETDILIEDAELQGLFGITC